MIAIDSAIAGKTLTNQTAGGQGFGSRTQNAARKRLARRLALTRLMVERKRAPSNRGPEIRTDDRFGCGQPSFAGSCTNGKVAPMIGIGGHLVAPPLPHHRAYGSVPRRFDQVKRGQERRGGEDRDRRNTGCAEPVGRPDVRTCARNRSASRQQPPRGTLAGHAVVVL